MKIYNSYSLVFITTIALLLATGAMVNFFLDPFQIYHNSIFNPNSYIKNQERFQNVGLIRRYWDDEQCCKALLLGTSLSENFENNKTGEILGTGPVLNLSLAGGLPFEQYHTLDQAMRQRKADFVFWELHAPFADLSETVRKKDAGANKFFPDYLYDEKIINDYPYLLSSSTLRFSLLQLRSKDTLYNHKQWYSERATDFGQGDKIYKTSLPLRIKDSDPAHLPVYDFYALEKYILPAVREYKETRFVFFFPPYTLHSHASEKTDDFARIQTFRKKLVGALSPYPNASVYMFDDILDEAANLDNYKDVSHYNLDVGYKAMKLIKSGKGRLDKGNIDRRLQAWTDRANAYCHTHKKDCVELPSH